MAGTKNLIRRSPNEARELGRLGGIASGKARREQKAFREIVQRVSNMGAPSKVVKWLKSAGISEENVTYQTAIVLRMFDRALSGDVAAFNAIVKTVGEMIDRHEVTGRDGEPLRMEKQLSMAEIRAKLRELDEE